MKFEILSWTKEEVAGKSLEQLSNEIRGVSPDVFAIYSDLQNFDHDALREFLSEYSFGIRNSKSNGQVLIGHTLYKYENSSEAKQNRVRYLTIFM